MSLGRALVVLSTLSLFHAAFSTYEHLSTLKALGQPENKQLPWDIVLELGCALAVFIVGVSLNSPDLKEITWKSEMKRRTVEEMDSRLSFASFNHRGRSIFGTLES